MNVSDVIPERIRFYDIAKGIGIISVVWAHSSGIFTDYINQMHMPLFFLISGILYSSKRGPKEFTIQKLKHLYIPYIFWNLLAVIVKGFLSHSLSIKTVALVTLTVLRDGQFFGATWFLASLLQVSIIFRVLDYYIHNKHKEEGLLAIFIAIGLVGLFVNFPLTISRTMVLGLFFAVGHYFKTYKTIYELSTKNTILYSLLFICFIIIGSFNHVVMNQNQYRFHLLFVIGALFASYAIIYFSKYLDKIGGRIVSVLSFLGKNSLDIVIWHFVTFRIVIIFQLALEGVDLTPQNILQYYPCYDTSHAWWLLYVFVGIVVPIGGCHLVRKTKLGVFLSRMHII